MFFEQRAESGCGKANLFGDGFGRWGEGKAILQKADGGGQSPVGLGQRRGLGELFVNVGAARRRGFRQKSCLTSWLLMTERSNEYGNVTFFRHNFA